jgi:predicted HicB family RNase H-like nuclease
VAPVQPYFQIGDWKYALHHQNRRVTFYEAVIDDYLNMCAEDGIEPEKPFKGTFNLRLDPELHKRLVVNATDQGMTLNAFVKGILEKSTAGILGEFWNSGGILGT